MPLGELVHGVSISICSEHVVDVGRIEELWGK